MGFGAAATPTTGAATSCTTSALDNCVAPIDTFTPGLAAGCSSAGTAAPTRPACGTSWTTMASSTATDHVEVVRHRHRLVASRCATGYARPMRWPRSTGTVASRALVQLARMCAFLTTDAPAVEAAGSDSATSARGTNIGAEAQFAGDFASWISDDPRCSQARRRDPARHGDDGPASRGTHQAGQGAGRQQLLHGTGQLATTRATPAGPVRACGPAGSGVPRWFTSGSCPRCPDCGRPAHVMVEVVVERCGAPPARGQHAG